MKTTVLTISRSGCHRTFQFMKMATSSKKFSTKAHEEDKEMTLRANKRKRARDHYKKRHGVDIPEPREPGRGNEKVYYLDKGLRKVYPYYFNFSTYVKGRWLGKTILDVFSNEFSKTGDSHKELIDNGKITVNGKKVTSDFILGQNMFLEHKTHRHEMPVLDEPIEILEDTDELVVINKPASIPVHPCGRYRENSITQMLKLQYGYSHLRVLYRLDRLTSGLLIMPKTTKTSRKLESQLNRRLLHKQYVCRVVGKFPDGEVECNEPLGCVSMKLSIYGVDKKNGKESSTTFTRLSYNGRTSVVKCIPHTGRTHQIRLHLQYLGYPICNDPIYNSLAFGPNKGKAGVIERTCEEIEASIMTTSNVGRWIIGPNPRYIAKFGEIKSVKGLEVTDEQQTTADMDTGVETTNTEVENLPDSQHTLVDHAKNAEVKKIDVTDKNDDKLNDSSTVYSTETVINKRLETVINDSSVMESDIPSKRLKITDACEEISDVPQDIEGAKDITQTPDVNKSLSESSQGQGEDKNEMKEDCNEHIDVNINAGKESGESNELTDEKLETKEGGSEKVEMNEDCMETGVKVLKKSFILQDVAKVNTDSEFDESRDTLDEYCDDCKILHQDPDRTALMIYLHAVSYKGPDWEYSTTLPYWASEDFDERTDTNS